MQEFRTEAITYFHSFQSNIEGIALPDRFNYPHHYVPHELAVIAAKELQDYLLTQTDWEHDFGFENREEETRIGKMFGVLVVRNKQSELGYLCAVSGALAGHNQHKKFVPPVFDILEDDGFFRKEEAVITAINHRVASLEANPEYLNAKNELSEARALLESELYSLKQKHNNNRDARHASRRQIEAIYSGEELTEKLMELNKQSIDDHYQFKKLKKKWKEQLAGVENSVGVFQDEIDALKEERKNRSSALQDDIFERFYFVNKALEKRSVGSIFKHTAEGKPTAGAGECAAPKLLQYAFLHGLEPIALAEFWWGQPPKTEVRMHGQFYPACRGKCEPILGHMLLGMDVEDNPLMKNPATGKNLTVIWEDPYIVVINKPHEFLSVPGRRVEDSALTRLKERYPEYPELMVAHRLDMSTSGLLVAAKTLEVYKSLQSQFLERLVKKRYVALLEGTLTEDEGWIDLPLRVNIEDRPRQMVCYEYGKPAKTRWQVIDRRDGYTRVHFYPISGRTHQLRVHAAHALGLNHPIVGDDLYGQRSSRLHLHADRIEFHHPFTNDVIVVEAPSEF